MILGRRAVVARNRAKHNGHQAKTPTPREKTTTTSTMDGKPQLCSQPSSIHPAIEA